ncbi:MAG: hypothetical protein PUK66_02835 [Bacteroidales bacterium]|uniref:hypothetical protein n=1 Tax=Porphyromonas sp. TaxID=1924944 RepID=UPI002972EF2A|nr:hypothetical protein [Porphyromonas sp.]MDD7437758.1 hypothetical protein [Bacteroidales bacterium]MDY3067265.1 hypothetical protein [Porphyromonas sp.]
MDRIYNNKWDRFSLVTTIVLSIVVLIAIVLSIDHGGVVATIVSLVLFVFFLFSILLRPRRTKYIDQHVIVDFPIGKKVLDMRQYSSLSLEKPSIIKSIRLFANGGYFGYSGIWRMYIREKNSWVTVRSYATNKDEDVVLLIPHTKDKKCVLINLDPTWLSFEG